MSSATVKPIPATVAAPTSGGQGIVSGNRPSRRGVREPGRRGDADELADDEADDDAERDAGREPAVRRPRRLRVTPALASANSGTIT